MPPSLPTLATAALQKRERQRWITPDPLNVTPALIGLPLAAPSRRAVAIAIDLGLIALLSDVSGLWLLGGLAAVVLQLRSQRGQVTRKRQIVGWLVAGVLALLALQAALSALSAWHDWRRPAAVNAPVNAAAVTAAATAPAGASATADDDAAPAPESAASAPTDAQRIEQLEDEVARLRKAHRAPTSLPLKEQLGRFLDDLGAGLGWGIVYFSLLPAWWGGQTVGKKLLRLRVVELTGKPMTVMRNLKRYGGYAAGVATGGIGFAQALWDPNRQGLHDKAAHTAVIDLRLDLRLPALGPPAGQAVPEAAVGQLDQIDQAAQAAQGERTDRAEPNANS